MDYVGIKLFFGVLATIALYSVLYKENKFYRFFEHVFLGLAAGYTIVILWSETLKPNWWDAMVGVAAQGDTPARNGMWALIFLFPIGLMGYFVFSAKNNWISRIPIGIILGLFATEQFRIFTNRYGSQLTDSLRPIVPTTFDPLFKPGTQGLPPEQVAQINSQVYASQAVSNLIYVITLLSVLSYFLFSFELKNKAVVKFTTLGRWLLMIGFGAIFGSTVMMRFSLLIDRMYFIWIEFFSEKLLGR